MRARVALLREGILTAAAIFFPSRALRFRDRARAEYGMHIDYIEQLGDIANVSKEAH